MNAVDALRTYLILRHAKAGDTRLLEKHLETGGQIDQTIREFLVRHLRGELSKSQGNSRTFANENADHKLMYDISSMCRLQGISRNEAIRRYLEKNPSSNEDTVKSALKRVRKLYPEDHFKPVG